MAQFINTVENLDALYNIHANTVMHYQVCCMLWDDLMKWFKTINNKNEQTYSTWVLLIMLFNVKELFMNIWMVMAKCINLLCFPKQYWIEHFLSICPTSIWHFLSQLVYHSVRMFNSLLSSFLFNLSSGLQWDTWARRNFTGKWNEVTDEWNNSEMKITFGNLDSKGL